jgi:hypothetical protein
MSEYKDWIVRFYASHKDIPKGHSDCETLEELIRCKDCKYFHHSGECILFKPRLEAEDKGEAGFCAWAERREE